MIDAILANSVLPTVHENFPTQVVELGWLLSVCILLPSRPKIVIFYPRAGCRCGAGGCQPVREAVAAGLGRGAV
jgi:hypothetical protein